MPIIAVVLAILAFACAIVAYADYHSVLHPVFLFNVLWFCVTLILLINTMGWYAINNVVYGILLLGLISFNVGGVLIGYGTLKDVHTIRKSYTECRCTENKINYKNVGNKLILIQIILTVVSIPLFLRGLQYISNYGMSQMRNIFSDGVTNGYMTATERVFYIHLGIFPAMQACSYIQIFLWVKGKIKGRQLFFSVIDLLIIVISTAGRWEIMYFALAMLCAFMLNRKLGDSDTSKRKQKKLQKSVKLLIGIACVALALVTIQRHKVTSNIVSTGLNVVAKYFCCGPALLQVALNNPVDAGISKWHFGLASFSGLLDVVSYCIKIVSLKKIDLIFYNPQEYMSTFFEVGEMQKMNAYPTWYYYFMQDFGYLGVIFFSMIIGGISVKIYQLVKKNPNLQNQLIYFYMLHVILFSSIWFELRRADIIATILHNLWILPLIGVVKVRKKHV